jgi:hypothetical protein
LQGISEIKSGFNIAGDKPEIFSGPKEPGPKGQCRWGMLMGIADGQSKGAKNEFSVAGADDGECEGGDARG